MTKMRPGFDPDAYATVANRIRLFYASYPLGRIQTELVSRTAREVIFKALVFRTPDDKQPAATGWAAEREGDGEINLVACLENTETSAVGRALANLGFTAARERPSVEELIKASHARRRLAMAEGATGKRGSSKGSETLELRPRIQDRFSMTLEGQDALQSEANAVADALALLQTAERFGLRRKRGDDLRARLLAGAMSAGARDQWTALLQRWIEKRRGDALTDPYLG